jgi:hypothetical protein
VQQQKPLGLDIKGQLFDIKGQCRLPYPTGAIPAVEMVKPRPEMTLQVTPLSSERQLNGPAHAT